MKRTTGVTVVMRVWSILFVVVILTSGAPPALAQGRRSIPTERFFDVQWQVEQRDGRDVAVTGSLANQYLQAVSRVLLQVQIFDQTGRITDETFGAIAGDVPAGARVTFRLPLEAEGVRYAVLVHAFEFGTSESP
jgi:hypothetical protein